MIRFTIPLFLCAAVLPVSAQPKDPPAIVNLRNAGVAENPGPIPTFYDASTKERALRFQKSLKTATDWYEQQLGVRVPLFLVVVTAATREKAGDHSPMPHNFPPIDGAPGAIFIPEVNPSAEAIQGSDDDHKPGGLLQNEPVLFHEYAHLLAVDKLNLASGNYWINEVVANMFAASYIAESRTDLAFFMHGKNYSAPARYTSLADLDYLGSSGMDPQNYYWFEAQLERIAEFLVKDQPLPAIVSRLKTEFPLDSMKHESMEDVNRRLSSIRPGFLQMAGPLLGPATVAINNPVACPDPNPDRTRTTLVVVHNRTPQPIVLTLFNGTAGTVLPMGLRTLSVYPGAPIKLQDGRCIVPRADPTVTIFEDRG